MAKVLEELRKTMAPDPQGVMSRIVNLALSRYAIDPGEGLVDLPSLARLGGVTEGRVRNMLSNGEGGLEKFGHQVTAGSAANWLKGRKDVFHSIWQMPDDAPAEPPGEDFPDEVVFVPVATDGSIFHPGLARNGRFTIGSKGFEIHPATFEDALSALQKMGTPRWRRPNSAGNWGIVSGKGWMRLARNQFTSPQSGA